MLAISGRISFVSRITVLSLRGFVARFASTGLIKQPLVASFTGRAPAGKKKRPTPEPKGKNEPVSDSDASDAEQDADGAPIPGIKSKDLPTQLAGHIEYCRRELAKVRGATATPGKMITLRSN
jgi:hypothetical protein